jgi:hypothetical protein
MFPDGKSVAETVPEPYRKESPGMRGVRDKLKASNINWTFFSPARLISPGIVTKKYRLGATELLMDRLHTHIWTTLSIYTTIFLWRDRRNSSETKH